MTELFFVKLAWGVTSLSSVLCTLGLLKIYRSYEQSLTILVDSIHMLSLQLTRSQNGTGIPSVAEDTEMGE